MSPISRGFQGRRSQVDSARVPPGQHVVEEFPVLSVGSTPHTLLDAGTFQISGALDRPVSWTWEELLALPAETPTVDIHCVTAWSKLDTTWMGVSVDTLLAGLETEAEYVRAWCDDGYRTNLPLEDMTGGERGSRTSSQASSSTPSTAGRPGS
jgi:DMSO/TMAO reductase YedYZ molybdopterin-dependent catalytic subunit